jgi:hypothetical protein
VRALEGIEIPTTTGANGAKTTQVDVPGLAPPGRKIRIAVVMLLEVNNKARVVLSDPLSLEIPT